MNPELVGRQVEVLERVEPEPDSGSPVRCRLHECECGVADSVWLHEDDLKFQQMQLGSFFYGALVKIRTSSSPLPCATHSSKALLPGDVVEVCERRVVERTLRLKIAKHDPFMKDVRADCWVSEYKTINSLDGRLGGLVQMMRLKGRPKDARCPFFI